MWVWEIVIKLDGTEYQEVGEKETQEKYHAFINDLLMRHGTYFDVGYTQNNDFMLNFSAETEEEILEIQRQHRELFKNNPPNPNPVEMEFRTYESII